MHIPKTDTLLKRFDEVIPQFVKAIREDKYNQVTDITLKRAMLRAVVIYQAEEKKIADEEKAKEALCPTTTS